VLLHRTDLNITSWAPGIAWGGGPIHPAIVHDQQILNDEEPTEIESADDAQAAGGGFGFRGAADR
jgi:hypothetical protein